jgi:hypothetical protein
MKKPKDGARDDMIKEGPVFVLQSSDNYKINVMIGAVKCFMTPLVAILDIRAGPNNEPICSHQTGDR